jgi:hypothetical protein
MPTMRGRAQRGRREVTATAAAREDPEKIHISKEPPRVRLASGNGTPLAWTGIGAPKPPSRFSWRGKCRHADLRALAIGDALAFELAEAMASGGCGG